MPEITHEEAFDAARLNRKEAKVKSIEARARLKEAEESMRQKKDASGQEKLRLQEVIDQMRDAFHKADYVLGHAIRDETQALDREQRGM